MDRKVVTIIMDGGATSQLCALATGLFVQEQYNRPFKLRYVHSEMAHTDGFVLGDLVESSEWEIGPPSSQAGINPPGGRIWKYVPGKLSVYVSPIRKVYEKLLTLINFWRLSHENANSPRIRLRYSGDLRSLKRITKDTISIEGRFWPGIVRTTVDELQNRFSRSSIPNIFATDIEENDGIAIHYRLGDMRTDATWKNTHGVMDPKHFIELVKEVREYHGVNLDVTVFSDEPEIARQLLEEVGADDWNYVQPGDIWTDLSKMIGFRHFLGTYSTVSMLIAEIRVSVHSAHSTLPLNCRTDRIHTRQKGIRYFKAVTLPINHWVYQEPNSLSDGDSYP